MINLFENYNQETQELHHSLKHAGYNHFTIVIMMMVLPMM